MRDFAPYVLVDFFGPIDRQLIYAKQGETFDYTMTDALDTKGVRSQDLIPAVRGEMSLIMSTVYCHSREDSAV
jgi:hypothetical protein